MEKILLFIPMYNCKKQILRVLEKLTFSNIENITEVLIIDNISKDSGENEVINYLNKCDFFTSVKLIQNKFNYGLGGSHKVAFEYAINNNFDYVIVLHGDDQADINDLKNILNERNYLNYDSMLGARFLKGSNLNGYSNFRIFGNKIFNLIFSSVLKSKIYDLGSGINMYNVDTLKSKYYIKYADDLTFNCYMLLATATYKQKIKFFNFTWSELDQISNVKMFKQSMNTFKLIL